MELASKECQHGANPLSIGLEWLFASGGKHSWTSCQGVMNLPKGVRNPGVEGIARLD